MKNSKLLNSHKFFVLLSIIFIFGFIFGAFGLVNLFDGSNVAGAQNVDNAIEFVYLDKTNVSVGDKIDVVVGINENYDSNNVKLSYSKEDNGQENIEVSPKEIIEDTARFELEFATNDQAGLYNLNAINVHDSKLCTQKIDEDNLKGYSFCVEESLDKNANINQIPIVSYDTSKGLPNDIFNDVLNGSCIDTNLLRKKYQECLKTGNNFIVALDPGHGGSDPGAGYGDLVEKDLNWKVAKACKSKLESYTGVAVYLTRGENDCPSIVDRVNNSIANGAQIIVSLHMNSAGGMPSGCEVLVPHQGGWHSELFDLTGSIGNKIMEKLKARFGLGDRGLVQRTEPSRRYDDGTIGDYYGICFYARQKSKPGMIVEHAFINGDYNLLRDDNNLRDMGIIDAQALAEQFGFSEIPRGENIIGTYYIEMESDSDAVVDVYDSSLEDEANVQIERKSNSTSQLWRIVTDQNGMATVFNVNSGKVLDVDGACREPRTNIQQFAFNESDAQKWSFFNNQDGTYTIFSGVGNNMVIDVDEAKTEAGTNIKIFSRSGHTAQRFKLSKVEQPEKGEVINGTFTINYAADSRYAVDIYGASFDDGANVQLYESNGSNAQKFYIETDDDGYATIINVNSLKVLDVYGGWTYARTNVQQYESNTSDAQKWKISKYNNGYLIIPKCNENIALDVFGNQAASGTNIQTYYLTKSNSQVFSLTSVENPVAEVNGTYFIDSSMSPCNSLDVAGGSLENGANVQIYRKNGTNAQKWEIKTDHNTKAATIKNIKSGKYLDVAGAIFSNYTNIWQYSKNDSNAQKWIFMKSSNGYRICSVGNLEYCIDLSGGSLSDGTNVQLYKSNGTCAQTFNLSDASAKKGEYINGTYWINSAVNSSFVLDVYGGSIDNAANVQLYNNNNTNAQKWDISTDEYGYATIKNVRSGKVVDVYGGFSDWGTNIQQYNSNGSLAQKWKFVKNGDTYNIVSAINDYICIDISCGQIQNGSNIQIFGCNNTAAQCFTLTATEPSPEGTLICASPRGSINQMIKFFNSKGKHYPSEIYTDKKAASIDVFAEICYQESVDEGIDPAILFCQAMKETGWLQFGGLVKAEQCNFGGLGATGPGEGGASFPDVRTGLRAQVQHLKAYACTSSLVHECVDPRFDRVQRGCAPCVEDLNGKWAVPGDGYGQAIVALMNEMIKL